MTELARHRDINNYLVSFHRQDLERLIVVFASAGIDGPGEPIEEFKQSLMQFGASLLFVIDRNPSWYNHPETSMMHEYISDVASDFPCVAALGESMGGSGALNFG